MMVTPHFLLLVLAFMFFVLGAFKVPNQRIDFVAAGLAFWILSLLI